jgi:hypothetical protein
MFDFTSAVAIESANFFVFFACVYSMQRLWAWVNRKDIDEFTRQVICAFAWFIVGVGLNRGWFAASRHFHDAGMRWNGAMIEWRHVAVTITAGMVAWGIMSFCALIDELTPMQKYVRFGIAFIMAYGLGFY